MRAQRGRRHAALVTCEHAQHDHSGRHLHFLQQPAAQGVRHMYPSNIRSAASSAAENVPTGQATQGYHKTMLLLRQASASSFGFRNVLRPTHPSLRSLLCCPLFCAACRHHEVGHRRHGCSHVCANCGVCAHRNDLLRHSHR